MAQLQTVSQPDFDRSARLKMISQTVSDEIPLVIAHRGASGYLPEHTTEAAAFAHALGADFIEQDVVLTKDGIPVVLHDVTLDAVTDVDAKFPERRKEGHFFVWDFKLAELRQLNVHERAPAKSKKRFPQDRGRFRVATLEQHIQLIQGLNQSRTTDAGVYVEIKSPAKHRDRGLDPSVQVLRVLKKYGYNDASDRVFLQCFDENEVLRLRTELKCRLPLIQLVSEAPSLDKTAQIAKVADGIGVPIAAVLAADDSNGDVAVTDVVKTAHQHAMMVHVWTFRSDDLPAFTESPEKLLDLLIKDAGVDGVFADQPDIVLKWRAEAGDHVKLRGPFHLLNSQ